MKKTLVIHVVSTDDTRFLNRVYDGLGYDCMLNPTRNVVDCMLKYGGYERVILLGHGDRCGLYDSAMSYYLIDGSNAYLLDDKEIVGVWCYAAEFADLNNLKGFFTSMFISNFSEAEMMGFHDTLPSSVASENEAFADGLKWLLANGIPLREFPVKLQEACHAEVPFVRFNYEGMCYYG